MSKFIFVIASFLSTTLLAGIPVDESLQVEHLPYITQFTFLVDVDIPANAKSIEIARTDEVVCFIQIKNVSGAARYIPQNYNTYFYAMEKSQSNGPKLLKLQDDTLGRIDCQKLDYGSFTFTIKDLREILSEVMLMTIPEAQSI